MHELNALEPLCTVATDGGESFHSMLLWSAFPSWRQICSYAVMRLVSEQDYTSLSAHPPAALVPVIFPGIARSLLLCLCSQRSLKIQPQALLAHRILDCDQHVFEAAGKVTYCTSRSIKRPRSSYTSLSGELAIYRTCHASLYAAAELRVMARMKPTYKADIWIMTIIHDTVLHPINCTSTTLGPLQTMSRAQATNIAHALGDGVAPTPQNTPLQATPGGMR